MTLRGPGPARWGPHSLGLQAHLPQQQLGHLHLLLQLLHPQLHGRLLFRHDPQLLLQLRGLLLQVLVAFAVTGGSGGRRE